MQTIRANEQRIKKRFTELVSIDSISFSERNMADRLNEILKETGFEVMEDCAGRTLWRKCGKCIWIFKGTVPATPNIVCGSHGYRAAGISKKAVFHKSGRITSDGSTILGSDDVAGIVEIIEGIRYVQEHNIPYGDVEILFPIAEEFI